MPAMLIAIAQRTCRACTALTRLAPLQVLSTGHVVYLAYVGLLCGAAHLLLGRAAYQLQVLIVLLQKESRLGAESALLISDYCTHAVSVLYAPIVLTALVLPARQILTHKRLALWPLLRATPAALRDCFHTLLITVSSLLYISSPALILVAGYFFAVDEIASRSIRQTYIVCCLTVCVLTALRTAPLYFTPLLALCAPYSPPDALSLARRTLQPCVFRLFLTAALGAAALYALSRADFAPWLARASDAVVVWYVVTELSQTIHSALIRSRTAYHCQGSPANEHHALATAEVYRIIERHLPG